MVRVWFFSISFPIFMIMCVWYLILICVFLIFELCRVLEDLMRKITDGRHGWNLYWMNTFLFNASYMPTHTRVNVICIVWIAWMGLYVHSVCLIIKTTVLFRYAMCFFFWVKMKKKKKSTESFAHSVVLIILFHPILVSGHLTFLSKFSAIRYY